MKRFLVVLSLLGVFFVPMHGQVSKVNHKMEKDVVIITYDLYHYSYVYGVEVLMDGFEPISVKSISGEINGKYAKGKHTIKWYYTKDFPRGLYSGDFKISVQAERVETVGDSIVRYLDSDGVIVTDFRADYSIFGKSWLFGGRIGFLGLGRGYYLSGIGTFNPNPTTFTSLNRTEYASMDSNSSYMHGYSFTGGMFFGEELFYFYLGAGYAQRHYFKLDPGGQFYKDVDNSGWYIPVEGGFRISLYHLSIFAGAVVLPSLPLMKTKLEISLGAGFTF